MITILSCIVIVSFLFCLWLISTTYCIVKRNGKMRISQFLNSSFSYNKDAEKHISLILEKYNSGLLELKVTDKYMTFSTKNGEHVGTIGIKNKYFAYGNLEKYGEIKSKDFSIYRPKISTLNKIYELEKQFSTESSDEVILK